MWWDLEKAIDAAATAKIREYERYKKRVSDESGRRIRRSTATLTPLTPSRPTLWDLDRSYDPYHVRPRSSSISHSITKRLRSGAYEPQRPAGFWVPKPGGGRRLVSSFSIADEVISSRLYRSLLRRTRDL